MHVNTSGRWVEVKLKPLIQRTRSQFGDFVRCEMTAVKRFESRLQNEYECRIRHHVLALQDECRDHVGNEEMKLPSELQELEEALQHDCIMWYTRTARHMVAASDQRTSTVCAR